MITEQIRVRPGADIEVWRFKCLECGDFYDAIDVQVGDRLDHQCTRLHSGAWWIVRRGQLKEAA